LKIGRKKRGDLSFSFFFFLFPILLNPFFNEGSFKEVENGGFKRMGEIQLKIKTKECNGPFFIAALCLSLYLYFDPRKNK